MKAKEHVGGVFYSSFLLVPVNRIDA